MSKKYTKKHEWIEKYKNIYRVGISNYAQEQLGDIVMVELPDIGKIFLVTDEIAVLESVKAASDIYSPVSGEVVEINETLIDAPELVNEKPESDGWLFAMKISDNSQLDNLIDENEYIKYCDEL